MNDDVGNIVTAASVTSMNAESNRNNNSVDSDRMLIASESSSCVSLSINNNNLNNQNRSSALMSKFPLLTVITSRNKFPQDSTHEIIIRDKNFNDLLSLLYENTLFCRKYQLGSMQIEHFPPKNQQFPLLKEIKKNEFRFPISPSNIQSILISKHEGNQQKCIMNINEFPFTQIRSHKFPFGMNQRQDVEDCLAPILTSAEIRGRFNALTVQLNDIKLYPIFHYFHKYKNFPLTHSRYANLKKFPMNASVQMEIVTNSSDSIEHIIHQMNAQKYSKFSIDHTNKNDNNNADVTANANKNEIVDLIKTSMTQSIPTTNMPTTIESANSTVTTTTTTTAKATTTAKYGHERENQVQMEKRTNGREPHESNDVFNLQQQPQEQPQNDNQQQQAQCEQQEHSNDAIITENIVFINENPATNECERQNIDIIRDLSLCNFNNENVPTLTQIRTQKIIERTPAICANLFDQQVVTAEQRTSASLNNTATAVIVTSDNDLSHQSHPAVRSDVHDTSSQTVVSVDSNSGSGDRSGCCVADCVGGVSIGLCESLYTSRPNFELLLAQVPSDQRQRQCVVDCVHCAAECVDELLIAGNISIDSWNDWQETEISVDVPNVIEEREQVRKEEKVDEYEVLAMTLTKVIDCTVAEAVADVQTDSVNETEVEVEVEAEVDEVQAEEEVLPLSDNQTVNEIMKYEMKSVKAGLPLSTTRAVTLKPEQGSLSGVTARHPSSTLSSGRLLERDAHLSVDLPRRYGSKIGEVPRTQSEVSRSVSADTLNGGVLPTRTRLRRQRRMQSQDAGEEEPEDPIERLNRLRARISGALTEVKGVLKQYSTDAEDNPQSGNQIPISTARKPIEPSTTTAKQNDGPVQFRFVRKVRRRSIFNEEDEHKETSDIKKMGEKQGSETNVDSLKSIEEVKSVQTLGESHNEREKADNQTKTAGKTPSIISTKAMQSENEKEASEPENIEMIQEKQNKGIFQQNAHVIDAVKPISQNTAAENADQLTNLNKDLAKVTKEENITENIKVQSDNLNSIKMFAKSNEPTKENGVLNVKEKPTSQKHAPLKRNSIKKPPKCAEKAETDESRKNIGVQKKSSTQKRSSIKTNSTENINKIVESSELNSNVDVLNKMQTQRRPSLKSNVAGKTVKPQDISESQQSHIVSDKQDKNISQKGLSLKANSSDNIIKCIESENLTQRRASFNSIREIQKGSENSKGSLVQTQKSSVIPKIEIAMEKIEKIAVPTTLETVKEEGKPTASKTNESPTTQVENAKADDDERVTVKQKRKIVLKPKDGVRRASIAAVESSKIEPPVKVAATLDIKTQRRPSDSEAIIKKKASTIITNKTDTDANESVAAGTRRVKVIKRPSLKGNTDVSSTSVAPTMTTTTTTTKTTPVKAIETKVVDKVPNDNAVTAFVNETKTIAMANNSNNDAITKGAMPLLLSSSSSLIKTLPTQLVIDDAALIKLNETTTTTTTTAATKTTATENESVQDLIVPTAMTTTTTLTATNQTDVENNAMAFSSPLQTIEPNSQTQTTQAIGNLVVEPATTAPVIKAKDTVGQQAKVSACEIVNKPTSVTLNDSSATVNEVEKRINQEIKSSVAPDLSASVSETSQQVPAVRDKLPNDIDIDNANANNNSNNNSSGSSSSGVNNRANANINAFVAPQTVEQSLSATSSSASAVVIAADISDVIVVVADVVDVDAAPHHDDVDTKTLGAPIDSNSVTATTVRVTSSETATETEKATETETKTQTESTMPELKVGLAPVQAVQVDIKTDGAPPFNEPKEIFAKKHVIYKKFVRKNSIDKAAATIKQKSALPKSKDESAIPEVVPPVDVEIVPATEDTIPSDEVTEVSDSELASIPEPKPELPKRPPRKVKKKVIIKRQQRKLSISDTFFKEAEIEPIAPEVETLEKAIAYVTDDEYDNVTNDDETKTKPLKTCMHLREYEVGDLVMYAERFKKTQVRWKKGRVIERITSISYKLEVDGKEVPAHISYIKRYTDRRVNFGSKEYLEIDYEQIAEEEKKARSYSIWNMV